MNWDDWIQGFALVATGVVGKSASDDHGIQELTAGTDFRKDLIVLQGVGIDGGGAIESFARGVHAIGPRGQIVSLIAKELKRALVRLRGRDDRGLLKASLHLVLITLHP